MTAPTPPTPPPDGGYLVHGGLVAKARNRYFRQVLDRYASGPGATLLDYGCGPGDMLVACRDRGVDAVGVDASARSHAMAAARGLEAYLGDVGALPAHRRRFDVVFVQSVVEHVDDPVGLVTGLVEVTAPGGRVIVSAPTPGGAFWDDPTHRRPHTPASLRTMLELAGLEVELVSYVFAFMLGRELARPSVYRLMNLSRRDLGSNLIAVGRRP